MLQKRIKLSLRRSLFISSVIDRSVIIKEKKDRNKKTDFSVCLWIIRLFQTYLCLLRRAGRPSHQEYLQKPYPERYRCPGHLMGKTCENNRTITEHAIETALLDTVTKAVAGIGAEYKVAEKKTPVVNKSAAKQKLSRLKELYIDGDITKAEYTAQKEKITSLLTEKTAPPKSSSLQRLAGEDLAEQYKKLDKPHQRTFWRTIIDHITLDRDKNISPYFLP